MIIETNSPKICSVDQLVARRYHPGRALGIRTAGVNKGLVLDLEAIPVWCRRLYYPLGFTKGIHREDLI